MKSNRRLEENPALYRDAAKLATAFQMQHTTFQIDL